METRYKKITEELFGREFEIETGRLAKQANGAVLARYGETIVIATIVSEAEGTDDDFLPLTVNYQEKTFASGRIPGGYFKREGRPTEKEILTSRLTDRCLRPLFPKNYNFNTQIIITVLSADQENDPDLLCATAACAAIMVSDVPFDHALASVKVGRVNGELICNPTNSQLLESDIELIVAGTRDALVMVEGSASEVPEAEIVEALEFGHESLIKFIEPMEELVADLGIAKRELPEVEENTEISDELNTVAREKLKEAIKIPSKSERKERSNEVFESVKEQLNEKYPESEDQIATSFGALKKELMRELVVKDSVRLDGRGFADVRQITSEVGFLPRTHGSAVFTRGETQALVVATLGTSYDEQRIDTLEGEVKRSFLLHYNFPPFSVGETSFRLGPGRREIGHGKLAERSIQKVLPSKEDFPYTIRVVSDILESNGSSSMATICGTSMSLMDAGIPISAPVSGIAMGLIKEDDTFVILSDILGDEDHLGDMDFKVAGTEKGITGLQMDIKVTGVDKEILARALEQAREGRAHILSEMAKTISEPREDVSQYAPRIVTMQIKTDKIRDLIGPGGKNIKKIIEITGANLDVDDSGRVMVASPDTVSLEQAIQMVKDSVQEAEPGKIYFGTVKKIMDFGAFVEIFAGTDGLVHISELDFKRTEVVTDVLNEGDELLVKCLSVDRMGKIRLSRKEALEYDIEEFKKNS